MDGGEEFVTYLDTHVVIWLYNGRKDKFSADLKEKMNRDGLVVSAVVRLELQYLYEIKRIKHSPAEMLVYLRKEMGVREVEASLNEVVETAMKIGWTRDPFDRLIVAEAMLQEATLVTADTSILKHYELGVW